VQFREGALSFKDTTKINLYHTFGKTVYFCIVSHTKVYHFPKSYKSALCSKDATENKYALI